MMKIMPVAIPVQTITASKPNPANKVTGDNNFSELFQKSIQSLNDSQLKADETVQKFLTGEVQDIHTVMIALGEARLAMQLAVEVRNKLVEAYQEIYRMQV